MTHTTWTRLALAFAMLLAPVAILGCAEEKPTTPETKAAPPVEKAPGAPEKK
jgi:hypothetical protein